MIAHIASWWAELSLRIRLSLAFFAAVTAVVFVLTIVHVVEVSRRLERDLDAQAGRLLLAIEDDLRASELALDAELTGFGGPRGAGRALSTGRLEARVLGAQARLSPGRIDVLKVLGADSGTIYSSGHWPTSFGAIDPMIERYRQPIGRNAQLIDEPTPSGSAPALERWVNGASGSRPIVIVAGRFLGGDALAALRARSGAHFLALCPQPGDLASLKGAVGRCEMAIDKDVLTDLQTATIVDPLTQPEQAPVSSRVLLRSAEVGGHLLYVGLDRSGIDGVLRGILVRAVLVGFLSLVLAVFAGAYAARRLVQPIESLAAASTRLAGGDLGVRVAVPQLSGPEVRGLIAGFNGMASDLERDQQRLRQAERVGAWQEIARGLAHELKNPLTPILSAMEVIRKAHRLKRPDYDDILEEQATAVIEEVMRLKELSDAFARFARLPEQRIEDLNILEVIEPAVALYATDEGIQVHRDIAVEVPMIRADRTQLLTVLTNLVKNAAEAIDNHGSIYVGVARSDPATLTITIEDSGPGIAIEVAERLFTPYVTTKGSRGTGLGLALAHRIVLEHEGSIEVSVGAKLGGACFTLRLPMDGPSKRPDREA